MTAIIERVKKLLALSESSNIHEAELAAQKAQELLSAHNLTMESVSANTTNDNLIEKKEISNKMDKWRNSLAGVVAHAFDCQLVRCKNAQTMYFYGYQQNPQIAVYTFLFMQRTAERLCADYLQELKFGKKIETKGLSIDELFAIMKGQPAPKKYTAQQLNLLKNSYLLGIVKGVSGKFDEQKLKTPITPGALVPVMDALIEKKITTDFDSTLKTAQTRRTRINASAYERGSEDGNNIGVNRAINGKEQKTAQIGMSR